MSLTTTSQRTSLAPTNLTEAMRFADMLAGSSMVPKDYQGKPANCLVAIQWGQEIGLGPLQALQNLAVINGRPSLWGDAALALVQAHPAYVEHEEGVRGEGDALLGYCRITRQGSKPHEATFSVADAKKAGLWGKAGPWQQYPQRMLQLRARGFALRDKFADALRGVITAEEAQDTPPRDVQSTVVETRPVQPGGMLDHMRQQQGHPPAEAPPEEPALPLWRMDGRLQQVTRSPKGTPAIVVWCKLCEYDIGKAESPAALREWQRTNEPYFASVAAAGDGEASYADDVDRVRDLIEQAIMSPVAPEPQEA